MNAIEATLRGFIHVLSALGLLLLLWFANLVLTVPAALAVSEIVHQDIRHSEAADTLKQGFDLEWHSEFEHRNASDSQSPGLAATFDPRYLLGVSPQLANLESWWSGGLFSRENPGMLLVSALALGHGLLWTFLLGGILARFENRSAARGLAEFSGACGQHFGPLLRLALLSAPLYWLLYLGGDRLMDVVGDWTTEATAQTAVLVWALPAGLFLAGLLLFTQWVFDYAKAAVVVERKGAFSALGAAVATTLRRPFTTITIGLLHVLAFALLLFLWHLFGPGTEASSWTTVVLVFLASQLYIIARLGLRLSRIAAQLEVLRSSRGLRF